MVLSATNPIPSEQGLAHTEAPPLSLINTVLIAMVIVLGAQNYFLSDAIKRAGSDYKTFLERPAQKGRTLGSLIFPESVAVFKMNSQSIACAVMK